MEEVTICYGEGAPGGPTRWRRVRHGGSRAATPVERVPAWWCSAHVAHAAAVSIWGARGDVTRQHSASPAGMTETSPASFQSHTDGALLLGVQKTGLRSPSGTARNTPGAPAMTGQLRENTACSARLPARAADPHAESCSSACCPDRPAACAAAPPRTGAIARPSSRSRAATSDPASSACPHPPQTQWTSAFLLWDAFIRTWRPRWSNLAPARRCRWAL